jgi:hypothetical protein
MYIICSQSSDAHAPTYLLNVYNVVETVLVTHNISSDQSSESDTARKLALHINVAWMQLSDESSEQLFDYHIILAMSPAGEEFQIGSGQFSFHKGPMYRITAIGEMGTFGGPGIARIICRVKQAGTDGPWTEQSYPILVQEVPSIQPSESAPSGSSTP